MSSEQLENFRKEIYNKQEVDIQLNNMQNKMKEMEGLVHHMEHAMKKMKRSVSECHALNLGSIAKIAESVESAIFL